MRLTCAQQISYSQSLWRILTDVFDIYLRILRRVQAMTDNELGRVGDNYRILHSCPPCQYKVCELVRMVFGS